MGITTLFCVIIGIRAAYSRSNDLYSLLNKSLDENEIQRIKQRSISVILRMFIFGLLD